MQRRWPLPGCLGRPPKTTIVVLFVSLPDAFVEIAAFVGTGAVSFAMPGLELLILQR